MKNWDPFLFKLLLFFKENAENKKSQGDVRIGATVGHGQEIGLIVCPGQVLVLKAGPVDALSARAIALCEVAPLDHEAL